MEEKNLLCLCPCVSQVLYHFTGLLLAFRELLLDIVALSPLHKSSSFSIDCLARDRMWLLSTYVWLWSSKPQTL